jgi:hypothetical protein
MSLARRFSSTKLQPSQVWALGHFPLNMHNRHNHPRGRKVPSDRGRISLLLTQAPEDSNLLHRIKAPRPTGLSPLKKDGVNPAPSHTTRLDKAAPVQGLWVPAWWSQEGPLGQRLPQEKLGGQVKKNSHGLRTLRSSVTPTGSRTVQGQDSSSTSTPTWEGLATKQSRHHPATSPRTISSVIHLSAKNTQWWGHLEFNNAFYATEPTSNGWLILEVLLQRTCAIWLERLSSIFSHATNDTSIRLPNEKLWTF